MRLRGRELPQAVRGIGRGLSRRRERNTDFAKRWLREATGLFQAFSQPCSEKTQFESSLGGGMFVVPSGGDGFTESEIYSLVRLR